MRPRRALGLPCAFAALLVADSALSFNLFALPAPLPSRTVELGLRAAPAILATLGTLVPPRLASAAFLFSAASVIALPWSARRAEWLACGAGAAAVLAGAWVAFGSALRASRAPKGASIALIGAMRTEWAMRVLGYLLSALERAAGLSPATFARLSSSLALFALSPVPSSLLFLLTPLLPLPSLPPSILVYSQTPYGPASVFHHAGSNITSLRLGRAILGAKYAWGDSAFGGFYLPSFAAHARKAGRGLVLGLGCGIDAGELARAGWEVQAVELVPQVAQWAGEHFGLKGVDVRVGDAWGFLEEAAKVGDTWDLVVADLFAGSATTVADFFPRMGTLKAAVAPGGCLAVNIVARPLSAGPASTLFKKHFAHVRCFTESAVRRDGQPVPLREMAASVTNLAFFLSDARISFDVPRLTDADFAAMPIRSEMLDYFPRMEIDTGKSDFGGAWDSEEARVVEGQHRAAMLEMFDRVFWEAY